MSRHLSRRARRSVLAAWAAGLAAALAAAPVPIAAAAAGASTSAAAAAGPATVPAWTHDPARTDGPAHWASLTPDWAACGGEGDQSPVALGNGRRAALPELRADYPRVPLVVENTGHVVEVPQPDGAQGTLRFGGTTYRLVQWHVHVPSEHVLNGHRYAMEIHLVHRDSNGATAVLAVLADVARPGGYPLGGTAGLLRRTARAAPAAAGTETDTGTTASAADLLPTGTGRPTDGAVVTRYLTYGGSLTTPPCTTGVRWIVLPTPVLVGAGTVERLHAVVAGFPGYDGYPDNNRPLQPLGSREVLRRG
ncbi:carbonic anhydrase family protein [Krasilnikovia sp. MM14-A1259]|uniref:carbonic anhydrase family protein n=1 Tax=Krasilnikovia sp. MM14-A1259 TaxID=3373539 RepID=UPI00382BF9DC